MPRIIRCPICKKRIFDADDTANGEIEIKCPHCHNLVKITLRPKTAIKRTLLKINKTK